MLPAGLIISRIGPESDVLLRNLFEHYCHDMSEWFDIDTRADGSVAMTRPRLGLKVVWRISPESALQSQASRSLDQAPTGWATLALMMSANSLSCEGFDGMVSARGWLRFFGTNIRENGSSECSKPTHRLPSSGAPRFPGYSAGSYQEEQRVIDDRSWRFFRFASDGIK